MEGLLCGLVGLLLGLAALVATVTLIARWVLRPLDQAAKGRQYPAQFGLVDFLSLVFMAQLPTGLVRWMFYGSGLGGQWLVYGFAWIACALLWWTGVRTLSRAGIHHRWHRAALLALVFPFTVFAAIVVPPLSVMVVIGPFAGALREGAAMFAAALLGEAALLAALYACGRYTRWLVATAAKPDAQAEPPEPEMPVGG